MDDEKGEKKTHDETKHTTATVNFFLDTASQNLKDSVISLAKGQVTATPPFVSDIWIKAKVSSKELEYYIPQSWHTLGSLIKDIQSESFNG